MSNILTANSINKSYGPNNVLNDLSLSVVKGEIHSILGANGAGKTTFIKIVSTLLEMDSGTIIIGGYDIAKNRNDIKKIIGYVGQDTERSAYGRLSAKDNLLYFGQMHGLSKKKILKQIDIFSYLFDIENLLDKPFTTLSGGQKQIIIITRALLHDPVFVVLDEPTKGLDPLIANRMRMFLKQYVKEFNKTILLTSHILSEVDFLSDTVTLIADGQVLIHGNPNRLKKDLGTDVFFEINSEKSNKGIINSLNNIFEEKTYMKDGIISYPLSDLCNDSIKIFNIIKDYDNQAVFNYRYTTLEDVFSHNIKEFTDKFE